ncbi:TorF family putative porin [Carboxylicivirga sp. RSCT41]|uniref:TorF family putative porin n=1 Tax=Carboxylicivirga agarovorans TaxID=3417570 RepID=UPI003D344778
MKKIFLILGLGLVLTTLKAQEDNKGGFSVSADLVSRYVFRGVDYGNSPAFQPTIEYSKGGFSIGAWGSYAFASSSAGADAFQEADLYASYGFDFGLSVGITDYYYPGSSWFELEDEISSHAIELNLGYDIGNFSLAGNVALNDSRAGAGEENGVLYFEAGYVFKDFNVFVGGGDGWHVVSGEKGDFQIVNIGIGTEKEIKITETFSIPMFGMVFVNPNSELYDIVVGISF